jgi:hypothetical protein
MSAVEEFEEALTLGHTEKFVDFDSSPAIEAPSSTQQLLDELLGRFEDDGSPMFSPHGLTPEFCADFDE